MTATVKMMLKPLASLRLTVWLFAMGMFLILAGTLAQVDKGIWTVVNDYFRSPFVWIDLHIFAPKSILRLPGRIPFPGGFAIGGLLLVNLIAAHAVRFKLSRKRIGIMVLHLGVILLLVGELVTALFAQEGNMTIEEGSYASYVENLHELELAIIDPSNPDHDRVVVIPESLLKGADRLIQHQLLPFDVQTIQYMKNSQLVSASGADGQVNNPANSGDGLEWIAQVQPEVSGTDPEQSIDATTVYVRFREKQTDRSLGTYLVSLWFYPRFRSNDLPQKVTFGDKIYEVYLRFKRTYKPYTLHLIDFRHDKFVGTETPRNFSSQIRLVDPEQNEDRQVLIYMNHPLRYRGDTFYQASFLPGDTVSILQVVRNPGWLLPYISCSLVALGLLIHFGGHLAGFVRSANQ